MSNYVGSYFVWGEDKVAVWERDENGRRCLFYDAPFDFYAPDPDGTVESIYGDKLSLLKFDSRDEMEATFGRYPRRFESDIKPEAKVLMREYHGKSTPIVNFAFIDIEVDYSSKKGFSSPENPYAPINAVTIYQSWSQRYVTLAVPPPGWKGHATFDADIDAMWKEHKLGFKPHITICRNERELIKLMLAELVDADIISGWNSEFFDLPYIVKRILEIEPTWAKKLCFNGCKPPKEGEVTRFGKKNLTYTLYGRTHLDYLDLFKKFTFEGRSSYALGNIAQEELDIPKLDYDGTLEQLYHNNFIHFVTYNARDVEVLVKLDAKYKLIALVNQMAHENTVPFIAILGTVRYVETGIMNYAHNHFGLRAPDKVFTGVKNKAVEGAIVMTPFMGLWEWLGSVDITSLYPSVIRALNMSIETFIGQFGTAFNPQYGEDAWLAIKNKTKQLFTCIVDGEEITMPADEWHSFIREQNWAISAFGTIFDQSKPGMVASVLTFWFEERVRLQAEKKKYAKLAEAETDPAKKLELEKLVDHYDLLQLTKKIQLNSTYGALLNEAFRFGRREIGASVTGSGRQITKHMGETIGSILSGLDCVFEKKYAYKRVKGKWKRIPGEDCALALKRRDWAFFEDLSPHPVEIPLEDEDDDDDTPAKEKEESNGAIWYTKNDSIIYGDTDSCYFATGGTDYDSAVTIADEVAELTNASFPAFMQSAFNCTGGRENLIKAAREIVGERGLFLLAKKKYTIKVVNLDGKDLRAKPKLKSMGSEIKKADTPKVIQDFLKGMMNLILAGEEYEKVETFVNENRMTIVIKQKNLIGIGVSKAINQLDAKYLEWQETEKIGRKKVNLPGHVRAAINYNEMVTLLESGDKLLKSGDKGLVFYLKPNEYNYKSIAIPADNMHFPAWFKDHFVIDKKLTEQKMFDSKLGRIFQALEWEIPTPQKAMIKTVLEF